MKLLALTVILTVIVGIIYVGVGHFGVYPTGYPNTTGTYTSTQVTGTSVTPSALVMKDGSSTAIAPPSPKDPEGEWTATVAPVYSDNQNEMIIEATREGLPSHPRLDIRVYADGVLVTTVQIQDKITRRETHVTQTELDNLIATVRTNGFMDLPDEIKMPRVLVGEGITTVSVNLNELTKKVAVYAGAPQPFWEVFNEVLRLAGFPPE